MQNVDSQFGFGNWVGKIFLATDLVLISIFIALGVWLRQGGTDMPTAWHLSPELSVPSVVLFFKWTIGALFCILAFKEGSGKTAAASGAIFLLLLFDDVFQLHDIELEFFGLPRVMEMLLGTVLLVALAIGYSTKNPKYRLWFVQLVVMLAGLLFCGLVIDRLADHFRGPVGLIQTLVARFFSISEDGGEMIFGSLMAGHAFALLRHKRKENGSSNCG